MTKNKTSKVDKFAPSKKTDNMPNNNKNDKLIPDKPLVDKINKKNK
ncbi:hypothetical protein H3T50_07465 [Commensalibacter sp. M0134]|nr:MULTISPECIES: hypothetical protein [Commensalibacter]MBI0066510.1 hypothetical protein [Commensalibacter sp. M0134]MBI0070459.1 hypothetical protein [Commensalibacter sp. M0133]MBI0081825.1 hypothetical protein [Commensalibacter melissae]